MNSSILYSYLHESLYYTLLPWEYSLVIWCLNFFLLGMRLSFVSPSLSLIHIFFAQIKFLNETITWNTLKKRSFLATIPTLEPHEITSVHRRWRPFCRMWRILSSWVHLLTGWDDLAISLHLESSFSGLISCGWAH